MQHVVVLINRCLYYTRSVGCVHMHRLVYCLKPDLEQALSQRGLFYLFAHLADNALRLLLSRALLNTRQS
jgi:hypothetical protein